ncbi:MAG: hypothetical protein ACLR02_03055 [Clostridium sp.]|jgi:hypothetical protein|nr:hypothetical protein [Clostridium sp.]
MKKSKILLITLVIIISTLFSGCELVDNGMVKLGLKNKDFEYIKENKVSQIVIQSTRDAGFRFVVTDKNAINNIYDIVSSGKVKESKSTLDADYIFDIYIGEEAKSYKYVVSASDSDTGNFYDDEKAYLISKNLDDTIINNLSFVRKPRDFEDVYYKCILDVLEAKKDDLKEDNKVGVNIAGDVDCLKYMFSTDLEQFKKDIDKILPKTTLVENNSDDFDTVITVKNRGYSSKIFKTTITVDDKKNKIYETYYVSALYESKGWNIDIGKVNTKPENW